MVGPRGELGMILDFGLFVVTLHPSYGSHRTVSQNDK
jgi:hypothetical protein